MRQVMNLQILQSFLDQNRTTIKVKIATQPLIRFTALEFKWKQSWIEKNGRNYLKDSFRRWEDQPVSWRELNSVFVVCTV